MGVLSELEPNRVFHFFEEICNIPHGSGNSQEISNYLVEFAKNRKLTYIQDEVNNVIIIKEATNGYEKEKPVIIQGHMDMVAVKKPECDINMEKEPLRLAIEGDYIYAQGTSLGGDDGIAVAYALAILDADNMEHPRLEVIITVEEEVGMDGAIAIDLSMLKGKQLLNIDSEEEGILLTSCAGGGGIETFLPVTREKKEGTVYEVLLHGLLGGHSGVEIHKERGNANHLMARILYQISKKCPLQIRTFEGGLKDNAIPRESKATVLIMPEHEAEFAVLVKEQETALKHELAGKDGNVAIKLLREGSGTLEVLTKDYTKKALSFIINQPNGVQAMSAAISGLVETSLNLGILKLEQERLVLHFSVRSSVQSAKEFLIDKLCLLVEMAGGKYHISGDYPAWEYRQDSPLRDRMLQVYQEMYGQEMEVQAIHAGLECGILSVKIKDLDCVSFGPNMTNIHTTEEKLSISSTKRVWEYLAEVLRRK